MFKRILLTITIFQSIVIAEVGDFSITSSTHQIGIPSNLHQITLQWTTPTVGENEELAKYLWKLDNNSSSDLENDSSAKEVSASSNSLTINLDTDGEFYFHILPVLKNGDTGVDKTFGKIVTDFTPPVVSISTKVLENGEVEVSLSTLESSSKIYYTTDGSSVDKNSTLYSQPFKLYFPLTLKFRGVDSVGNWSEELSKDIDVNYVGNIVKFTNIKDSERIATSSLKGASSIKPVITLTAPKLSTYKYRIDLNSYSDYIDGSEGIDISKLSDGKHTLYVKGRDDMNNTQAEASTVTFIVDNTPPSSVEGYIDGRKLGDRNIYPISSKQLTLLTSDDDSNITIRYTTNGDTPSKTYGFVYSDKIDVINDKIIRAIAYDSLGNIGDVVDFNITFDGVPPEEPKIYDTKGELDTNSSSYYNGKYIYLLPQQFRFETNDNYTENPKVYWEIEGKTPNILTSQSGNVTISSSTTLKFMGVDEVNNSTSILSRDIVIDTTPPTLLEFKAPDECPLVGDTYTCTQKEITLTLSAIDTETPDSITINYTVDGSIPTKKSSSVPNDSNVTLQLSENTKTFQYIAYDRVGNRSDLKTIKVKYDIKSASDATEMEVTLSLDNNSSINGSIREINVTIINGGSLPIYYYKIDDNNFSHESNLSKGVDISQLNDGWHTLTVIASTGEINSTANTITFFIDKTPPASPTISGETPFKNETTISISTDDENATIYYSLDGATPTTKSYEYTAPFQILGDTTVRAIAVDRVGNMSGESSKIFEVQRVPTPNPSDTLDIVDNNETNTTEENEIPFDEVNNTTPDESNIVDIEESDKGEKLTIGNSSSEEHSINVNFQNLQVDKSDLDNGGREYIHQTDDINQTLIVSPNGAISGKIIDINTSISVEINTSLNMSSVDFGDGKVTFTSETITSDSRNNSQVTIESTKNQIDIHLVRNGEKIAFPTIPLGDGEEAKIKVYLRDNKSIEIELEMPLNDRLKF